MSGSKLGSLAVNEEIFALFSDHGYVSVFESTSRPFLVQSIELGR